MIAAVLICMVVASEMRSRSTISASDLSIDVLFSEAKAVTRMRAPSSSNVALDAAGDQLEYVAGYVEPVHLRLLAQDRNAGLEFGRLYIGDEPPFESGAKAILEGRQLFGRPV